MFVNVTTLSGDLNGDDRSNFANNTDNSYRVVTGANGATLDGFTISGGNADKGGGIYNSSVSPTLSNLVISGNTASWMGGGFYSIGGGPTLTNVTISGNTAGNGGGMSIFGSSVTLVNVTISDNVASGNGGGIFGGGSTTLMNVTISGNTALKGGGVYAANSALSLTNTTFSGNQATGSQDSGGGAILALGGRLTFTNVTIAGNNTSSGNGAGGISVMGGTSVTLTNTIVAGNTSNAGGPDLSGTVVSGGHNLIGDTSGSAGITAGSNGDLAGTSATPLDPKTVTAVNDAPSFAVGPNQTLASDAGAVTVSSWASRFSAGPADETSQTLLGYTIVSNSATELFSVAPAIDASGTLTYTPKPGAGGTATIGVVVRDSGGTASGGADTSTVRTFTITVDGSYTVYLPLALR
jgi:predicted outer membrane repeat protein